MMSVTHCVPSQKAWGLFMASSGMRRRAVPTIQPGSICTQQENVGRLGVSMISLAQAITRSQMPQSTNSADNGSDYEYDVISTSDNIIG